MDLYMTFPMVIFILMLPYSKPNHDAKRLYDDLLRKNGYSKLIRPVANSNDTLTVRLLLKFSQLVDVDEKNEIVTTNMWVIQEWEDNSLRWDPDEYGGIENLYVPSTSIWLPDIVLYNNADGDYTVTLMTKATLSHEGLVRWEPPAIYKSHCNIEVEYFPFDMQKCFLKFGSWTYDGYKVDLKHLWTGNAKNDTLPLGYGMDLNDYYRSQEWDLIEVPAKKNIKSYPCCEEPYPDITFNFTIRRKTLYYLYNLIIPCVSINMLTLVGFYLPCHAGEKISICISILLSLSLFQLLLMELVPATSTATPLMGAYILFTNILVSISVFSSVVVLNVNYRSNTTHTMPRLTKWLFLEILPALLFMKRPGIENRDYEDIDWSPDQGQNGVRPQSNPYKGKMQPLLTPDDGSGGMQSTFVGFDARATEPPPYCEACVKRRITKHPPQVTKGFEGIQFIAKHMHDDDSSRKVKEDWMYVSMVIDRLLLYVYTAVCVVGGMGMLLNAPALYEEAEEAIGLEMSSVRQ